MKLASHNSWSYLSVKKWYMKPFAFMARCQNKDILKQYRLGVRCFDLHIKMIGALTPVVLHGSAEYNIDSSTLEKQLRVLNGKGDCAVRVVLDVRKKKGYTEQQRQWFRKYCSALEEFYPHIMFWCGRNLYNWEVEYDFDYKPTCEENYASVSKPLLIDDWFPWLYAKLHNENIFKRGTDKYYLMVDFVNYGHFINYS